MPPSYGRRRYRFRVGVPPVCAIAVRSDRPAPKRFHCPLGANYHMFDLSLEVLRVVEDAAIASARTMGMGDAKAADHAAVEAMRHCMDTIPMEGTIVIGEGERDAAPMLYIGEKVGNSNSGRPVVVDIAVDPLEGTNLCATGAAGAITVLAASEKGGLLHAP